MLELIDNFSKIFFEKTQYSPVERFQGQKSIKSRGKPPTLSKCFGVKNYRDMDYFFSL